MTEQEYIIPEETLSFLDSGNMDMFFRSMELNRVPSEVLLELSTNRYNTMMEFIKNKPVSNSLTWGSDVGRNPLPSTMTFTIYGRKYFIKEKNT